MYDDVDISVGMRELALAVFTQAKYDLICYPRIREDTAKLLFLMPTIWSEILFPSNKHFYEFAEKARTIIDIEGKKYYDKIAGIEELPETQPENTGI